MNTPNIRRSVLGILIAIVVLAGCQRVERETAGGTDTAATTTPAPAAVTVNLSEYRIEIPSTIPAGPTTFLVTNTGKEKHNFEIEGEQLAMEVVADPLEPGQSRTLELDLKPGTYKVYCPMANHDERGMHLQLTVQ